MLENGGASPTEHTGEFLKALLFVESMGPADGAVVFEFFKDTDMSIGEAGDLMQVCDDDDLVTVREPFESLTDAVGGLSSDSGVDFIEEESLGLGLHKNDLESKGDAGELAAADGFLQGKEGFSAVGAEKEFDAILPTLGDFIFGKRG